MYFFFFSRILSIPRNLLTFIASLFILFSFFPAFLKLEDNCFTILHWHLSCISVNQPEDISGYIHVLSLLNSPNISHPPHALGCHRALGCSPSVKFPPAIYFTYGNPSPSEGRQTGNDNHRKLTNLITWTAALSNSMKHESCHVGLPKMDGPWWRVLTKCGPLEKGMANHFSIPALRTREQYEKAKR